MKLLSLPLSDIDLGRRLRQDYGDIESLKKTITSYGIIEPLVCIHKGMVRGSVDLSDELDPEKPFLLIAGGRRYTAVTQLNLTEVPVRLYTEPMESDEFREIELIENTERKDLTYDERAQNTLEYHRLRERRLGKGRMGTEGGATVKSTAEALKQNVQTVKEDIKIAKAIEKEPELKDKAKNRSEVLRILRQREEEAIMRELAKRQEAKRKKAGATEIKEKLCEAYKLGDCFEELPKLKSGVVGFVNLDPPWANVKMAGKKSRPNLAEFDNWTPEEYKENVPKLLKECHRIMAPQSWGLFWFSPDPWWQPTLDAIRAAGFTCNGIPLVWCKGSGHGENVQFNLVNSVEFAFYFRKGAPEIRKEGHIQEYRYPQVRGEKRIHKCEKPVVLMEDILQTFCIPGTLAVDPFCGSGALIKAAYNVGMRSVGYDLSETNRAKYVLSVEGNTDDKRFI